MAKQFQALQPAGSFDLSLHVTCPFEGHLDGTDDSGIHFRLSFKAWPWPFAHRQGRVMKLLDAGRLLRPWAPHRWRTAPLHEADRLSQARHRFPATLQPARRGGRSRRRLAPALLRIGDRTLRQCPGSAETVSPDGSTSAGYVTSWTGGAHRTHRGTVRCRAGRKLCPVSPPPR